MKHYPLGIDNPILVKGVMGSHKWALYWREDMQKIATFPNQFVAYQARQSIIESMTHKNPYVQNLIEMGYDETDVNVASTMFQKKNFL